MPSKILTLAGASSHPAHPIRDKKTRKLVPQKGEVRILSFRDGHRPVEFVGVTEKHMAAVQRPADASEDPGGLRHGDRFLVTWTARGRARVLTSIKET